METALIRPVEVRKYSPLHKEFPTSHFQLIRVQERKLARACLGKDYYDLMVVALTSTDSVPEGTVMLSINLLVL